MPFDVHKAPLVDQFGREVSYLRLSVTDRCDLRCRYCMPAQMTFLPRKDVLSLEQLAELAGMFVARGVSKIRITGGEPLVRKDILTLFRQLSRHLETGALKELTLTTNGTLLSRYAQDLADCGVQRVNVSLDTLDPQRYRHITRFGDFNKVMDGLVAAQDAGLKVKLNALASKGAFEEEVDTLIRFAHGRNMDLTLIEQMPLGLTDQEIGAGFLPLSDLRADLASRWTLQDTEETTLGPARYVRVSETGGRIGFITPMSCSFCAACNRVRLSCTGKLFTCMGHQGSTDLKPVLSATPDEAQRLLQEAILRKPKGHDFMKLHEEKGTLGRHMSVLGG